MNVVEYEEYFTEKKCMFCFNKKPASACWDYTDSNGHYSEIFICPICALDYLPMFLVDALMVTMKTKEDFNMFRQKIECRFQRAMDVARMRDKEPETYMGVKSEILLKCQKRYEESLALTK